MNRTQLLPQVELALVLLDLDLRLALDVFGDASTSNFALHSAEQKLQSLPDVESLQDLVLVGYLEIEVRRGEVGESAGIGDVHLEDRRNFVGNALDQLGQCLRTGHDAGDQVVHFVRIGRNLLRRFDSNDREGIGLHDTFDDESPQALQSDLHCIARQIDSLVYPGRHANPSYKTLGIENIVVIAARHYQPNDQSRLLVGFEQRQVFGSAHLHGNRAKRINNGRSKRHQRQRRWYVSLQDVVFTLSRRHSIPLERRVTSVVSEVNGA